MRKEKKSKGITLIALVVTIVVLLILAAVSISMLGGENGIITQAQQSKDKTEQAKVEEIVDLAINALMAENNGSTSEITPKSIADKINAEYSQYENVYAENETNFPTKIIFPEEGNREVEVDLSSQATNNIYSADVAEEDIAPADIFKCEIISDAETGATTLDSLPTKEARITGIKEKYCNYGGYTTDTGEKYENTNYEITLEDGTKITDTLVVPYQVEIEGEMYKIIEVDLGVYWGRDNLYTLPHVNTIIYPNTVKKIERRNGGTFNSNGDTNLEKVVFPKNLETIGECTFIGCKDLTSIDIPGSVTDIGNSIFEGCINLKSIKIPNEVTKIGTRAFWNCSKLESIEIPQGVESIGENAFGFCSSLTTVNYNGTMEQWKKINIDSSNTDYLNKATIICTDGTI